MGGSVTVAVLGAVITGMALQVPPVRPVKEDALREYAGTYQWEPNSYLYLQMWAELSGTSQLVAFDESGEIRTLYPTDADRFFAGPGAAVLTSTESRVEFQRDATGAIAALTWQRDGAAARLARRVAIERREEVQFSNGPVRLAGTLISPTTDRKHPAIVLVHGSGPASREQVFPLAGFLVRHGIAVFGYDKRGTGGSTGDWNTASFEELSGDVVAAFEYLKTRSDVDRTQIGLFGWSQAGWVMPIAAVRAKDIAFLISISGPGVPAAETTLDQAHNEMTARGMPPQVVEEIVGLMKLQYEFARTGQGWDDYSVSRGKIAARMGTPPDTFPGTPDHPYWAFIRRLYFYDPAPTLRQLHTPTLALFGERDNNIVADKNRAAWEAALKGSGNRDYTLRILPKANHSMLEAKVGSNAEMPSLQRFVPEYRPTILDWLAKRVHGFKSSP
ncbi:MAG: alpha/beta fold hydrolase [Vicinamibacterales bacterium]